MSNVAFLLIAVGIAVVGSLIVWFRYRKPKTFMSSINDFAREMDALGREPGSPEPRRGSARATHLPQQGGEHQPGGGDH